MIALILTALVALIHLYITWLEMVLWTKPRGRATFGTTETFADESKVLAANQGIYNGMVALGLVYGLAAQNPVVQVLFLIFVFVVGLYGGLTVGKKILLVQALPAALALLAMMVGV